jgi:hypothetical protein
MRAFWKTHANEGLENFLKDAIVKQIRYCHSFLEIPQVSVGASNAAIQERVFEAAEQSKMMPN